MLQIFILQMSLDNQVLLNNSTDNVINAVDDQRTVLGDDRVMTSDTTIIETEEKFATIVLDFSHVDFLDFSSANAIRVSCVDNNAGLPDLKLDLYM
jgi:hypothetical protein